MGGCASYNAGQITKEEFGTLVKQDQRFAAMLRREVEHSPLPSSGMARHPPPFDGGDGDVEAKAARPSRRPPPPPPQHTDTAGTASSGGGGGGSEGDPALDEGTAMALERIRSGELDTEQVGTLLTSQGLFTEFDDPSQAEAVHRRYALGIGSVKAIRMLRTVRAPPLCATHRLVALGASPWHGLVLSVRLFAVLLRRVVRAGHHDRG